MILLRILINIKLPNLMIKFRHLPYLIIMEAQSIQGSIRMPLGCPHLWALPASLMERSLKLLASLQRSQKRLKSLLNLLLYLNPLQSNYKKSLTYK